MGRLSTTDFAIILVPIVSLIFGIVQVSVQSAVQQSTSDTSLTAWPPAPIFGSDRLASVPDDLVRSVTDSLLAAGAITIVVSAFAALQAINTLYSGSLFKHWILIYRAVMYPSIVTNLAIFIYACVEETKSPEWQYSDTYSTGGRYAPESWNCQIRTYFPDLNSVCNNARAGRWLCLPILLCFIILAFFDIRPQDSRGASKGYMPK